MSKTKNKNRLHFQANKVYGQLTVLKLSSIFFAGAKIPSIPPPRWYFEERVHHSYLFDAVPVTSVVGRTSRTWSAVEPWPPHYVFSRPLYALILRYVCVRPLSRIALRRDVATSFVGYIVDSVLWPRSFSAFNLNGFLHLYSLTYPNVLSDTKRICRSSHRTRLCLTNCCFL